MITFQCCPGYNTGQHMFVPASDECNRIHINIDTGSTTTTRFDHDDGGLLDLEAPQQQGWMIIKTMMIMTTRFDRFDRMTTMKMELAIMMVVCLLRKWQIKTTQYTCESEMAPRQDCLQYHTAQYGRCHHQIAQILREIVLPPLRIMITRYICIFWLGHQRFQGGCNTDASGQPAIRCLHQVPIFIYYGRISVVHSDYSPCTFSDIFEVAHIIRMFPNDMDNSIIEVKHRQHLYFEKKRSKEKRI